MRTTETNTLFTDLSVEESAQINGGCYKHYYPVSYSYNPCYNPCYYGGYYGSYYGGGNSYGYGYGSGGYGSGGYGGNQTTTVNVLYDD